MADCRKHRGPHPEDHELFAPAMLSRLRMATGDLGWLLSRAYAPASSLKLVGDRFDLRKRQRLAVARCACGSDSATNRSSREVDPSRLKGRQLGIDGYNVLTSIEAALGGGVIIGAMDGCYRDMASMHGTYRKVEETRPAIELLGRWLAEQHPGQCHWLLDQPVSNSGRLKTILLHVAESFGWNWQVDLVADPDPILSRSTDIVISADSMILDRCETWFNLVRHVIDERVEGAWIVDLSIADKTRLPARAPSSS